MDMVCSMIMQYFKEHHCVAYITEALSYRNKDHLAGLRFSALKKNCQCNTNIVPKLMISYRGLIKKGIFNLNENPWQEIVREGINPPSSIIMCHLS